MKALTSNRTGLVLAAALAAIALIVIVRLQPAQAVRAEGAAADVTPRYTVLETEGTNLVVTDNGSNVLYFYTVDKGKAPGSELKLRAKLDLTKVGKATLMPEDINIQK
jgi:hypothetical protein